MNHPSTDVNQAIIQLNDALCMWERSTGRQSALIIQEDSGWNHRSINGKPGIPEDVTAEQILNSIMPKRRNE